MVGWFHALLLGAVQGLTEFLPVSSSGHLVLVGNILGTGEQNLLFDTSVHCGTLLAVFIVFRADLAAIIREPFVALRDREAWSGPTRLFATYPALRMILLILVGSVPTGIIGVAFKDTFQTMFSSLPVVGVALLATGTLLISTRLVKPGTASTLTVSLVAVLVIGFAQGLAITPGISRSGTTICVALLLGCDREFAGRFSFLLSIPAILGAEVLGVRAAGPIGVDALGSLAAGFASAAVVGYIALRVLLAFVKSGKIHFFAPYCYVVGAGTLIYVYLV